jgi:pSer/pThr/pTyr-binding forkhead associated (FHA) protein
MLGQLVPCGGGRPIPLLKPRVIVGRQSGCDIPLGFAAVSSRHCELEYRAGYWHVRDLGSKNGTRVNGTACTSQQLLPDDVLAVGGHRYQVAYRPPAGAPPPPRASPAAAAMPVPPRVPEPAPGASVLGQLLPCGGGDPIPLRKLRVVVGRHETCDVVLRAGTVSGRHCQLEWTDAGWFVRDLGSRNGIKVDNVRCEAKLVPPGSVLSIAGLRYEIVSGAGRRPGPPSRVFRQSLLEAAGLAHWQPPEERGGRQESKEE